MNNNVIGIKKRNIGNIDSFLCLIINIGNIITKRNTIFIEYEPINENPWINTSSDEKKCPGINQGKFKSFPLKNSKIDRVIMTLIWISPILDDINFAIMKAILQNKDKNNGSNAEAIGIKNI